MPKTGFVSTLCSKNGCLQALALLLILLLSAPVAKAAKASAIPAGLSFSQAVGSVGQKNVTIKNLGRRKITISSVTITGTGFSLGPFAVPRVLNGGQSATLTVRFAPVAVGSVPGAVQIISTASNSPHLIVLSGSGTPPPSGLLSVSPGTVGFGNVTVGTAGSSSLLVTNTGTAGITISQVAASGSGFGWNGLALPFSLAAGQSTALTVAFSPAGAGSATGNLSIVSDAANSPSAVGLSGNGVAPTFLLSLNPPSWSFGDVTVGSSKTQPLAVNNTGTGSVTLSSASAVGTSFAVSGPPLPLTLAPGQGTTFTAAFAPQQPGSAAGTASFVSNAANSPSTATLSGMGIPLPIGRINLTWDPSPSQIAGYNIYRATRSGGPYTRLNVSLVAVLSYSDDTVTNGITYWYVAKAVNSSGVESLPSNELSVSAP